MQSFARDNLDFKSIHNDPHIIIFKLASGERHSFFGMIDNMIPLQILGKSFFIRRSVLKPNDHLNEI